LPAPLARVLTDYEPRGVRAMRPPSPAGKFTLTLTKGSDGRWLIVADMDRSYPRR